MKEFWRWLTTSRSDEEMRRLEQEGKDIDVVYGLRPSFIYFALTLLELLDILLSALTHIGAIWDAIAVYVCFAVGAAAAGFFSYFMEQKWSWRRTGLTGFLVAVAVGVAAWFIGDALT